jgi:hypothetical protein
LFLLGNLGQQGLLARAAVIVIFEAGAVGAQLLGLLGAFGLQLGNLLGNGFGCFIAERLCLQSVRRWLASACKVAARCAAP